MTTGARDRQRMRQRAATEQRFAARARRRRLATLRPLGVALAVLALLAGLWWVVYRSGALAVQKVVVTGVHRVSQSQVLAAAQIRRGTPLVSLDAGAVRRRVAALAPVAAVSVERSWPHGVRISVTERAPVAVLRTRSTFRLLDRTGTPFWAVRGPVRGLPVIATDSDDPAVARAGLAVVSSLPRAIRAGLAVAEIPTPASVTLRLRGGVTVIWGDASNSAHKALVLARLMHAQHGTTYDVSAPDVATVR